MPLKRLGVGRQGIQSNAKSASGFCIPEIVSARSLAFDLAVSDSVLRLVTSKTVKKRGKGPHTVICLSF